MKGEYPVYVSLIFSQFRVGNDSATADVYEQRLHHQFGRFIYSFAHLMFKKNEDIWSKYVQVK